MARKKGAGKPPKAVTAWLPVVIELPPFSQKWGQYRLREVDRTAMLEAILSQPEAWPVQRGTSGGEGAVFLARPRQRYERRLSRFLRRVPKIWKDCSRHSISQERAEQPLESRPEPCR